MRLFKVHVDFCVAAIGHDDDTAGPLRDAETKEADARMVFDHVGLWAMFSGSRALPRKYRAAFSLCQGMELYPDRSVITRMLPAPRKLVDTAAVQKGFECGA